MSLPCFNNSAYQEFPGGQVVRTQRFHRHGLGSVPGWGTKILQAVWRGQKQLIN